MFSTKPVNSLKNLFARYHEPTPLSKQQSQKLLDGLKGSFRKQLDREYGHNSDTPAASKPVEVDQRIRHSAANQHLKSILSNPLFSYSKESISTLPPSVAIPARDPMDVFDHAVAKGMMTLQAATGCLMAKSKQVMASETQHNASSTEIAVRIVRWLRSSGAETDLLFLDNQPFVRSLVPFLIAEEIEPLAWEWIVRTMNDPSSDLSDSKRVKRASSLLAELVRIKSQPQYGNLNAAITTILEAEQLFHANPLLSQLLVKPWRSVSWLSTVESYSRTSPSEKLFDAHMATADRLPRQLRVETAHLHLHHPTHPDYIPALQFFNDKKALRELLQTVAPKKINTFKSKGMNILPWIAFLGNDTVNHLAQSGRRNEAENITQLLQSELASFSAGSLKSA